MNSLIFTGPTNLVMKCQIEKLSVQKVIFFLLALITSCIDPFTPSVEKSLSRLVVDALITDEDASYYCRLTRSFEENEDTPERVTGATVYVTDDTGGNFMFSEVSSGVYRSDSLSFRGAVGRAYTLHITSPRGEQYESDPVTMLDVPEIDSLYFGKYEVTGDDGLLHQGIQIYFDSEKPVEGKYLRWTYSETWKFQIPYPVSYEYFRQDSVVYVPPENVICWKTNNSDNIIIGDKDADDSDSYKKKPLTFIASDLSDRLTIRYYIKVRQYSISEDEYQFRDLLKQINDAGGDIFNRPPFQIFSNVHNTERPEDQVLGYFQVSAAREASLYVDHDDLKDLELPVYDYGCTTILLEPYLSYTLDDLYDLYVNRLGFLLVAPEFNEFGRVIGIFISTEDCADCRATGNLAKPDFWVDK